VQVTRALIDAKDRTRTDPAVIDAVHWNRRLWSTLMIDCSDDDNTLPDSLRAQIISLAVWVGRHSTAVMRGEEDVVPLIEVNRNIMEGLAAREAAAQT